MARGGFALVTAFPLSASALSRASAAPSGSDEPYPAADTIRQTAREILLRDAYQHDEQGWFRFDLSWLWEWLRLPFEALGNMMEGLPPWVSWVIIALLVLTVVALLAHVIYSFYAAIRVREDFSFIKEKKPPDPTALIHEAERLAQKANFVDASRRLYRAALILLENTREGRMRVGLTNREYLQTFQSGWVIENLRVFVELIDWKWYRNRSFDAQDYQRCYQAFRSIRTRLETTS